MTQKTISHEVSSQASSSPAEGGREHTNLDYRYGAIGILAVAAAVQYAGGGKNPAYAPTVEAEVQERFIEIAA